MNTQNITDSTDAALDALLLGALLQAAGDVLGAPRLAGRFMISIKVVTFRRLPCHADYATAPTFEQIEINVCGGLPSPNTRARRAADAALREACSMVETHCSYVGR